MPAARVRVRTLVRAFTCSFDYISRPGGASPSFGTTPRRSSKDAARVCVGRRFEAL